MKMLIVEDDFVSRSILLKILHDYGDVDVAVSAKETIEAYDRAQNDNSAYDVIFLDRVMPEESGDSVLKHIRMYEDKLSRKSRSTIIMTTSLDCPAEIFDAFNKQCEGTKQIREMKEFNNLPIVAMTAHTLKTAIDSYLEIGMNDYISKPIYQDKLLYIAKKWIKPQKKPLVEEPIESSNKVEKKSHLDLDGVIKRIGSDRKFINNLLAQFASNYSNTPSELLKYYENSEMDSLRVRAHTLKGTAAGIGATQLSLISSNIEKSIAENDFSNISDHIKEFSKEFSEVLKEINEVV